MPRKNPTTTPCSVDGCGRLVYAKTLCRPHWARWRRKGDLNLEDRGRAWTAQENDMILRLPTTRFGKKEDKKAATRFANEIARTVGAIYSQRSKLLKMRG